MNKRIAIIGAGPAGLASAKSCLEYGLEPIIFEKSSVVGGVWSGSKNSAAWTGMHTNLSKWSCMFSDFPYEQEIQEFPFQSEVANYLMAYANKFNVTKCIRFQSEVTGIKKINDKWSVFVNGVDEKFDAVIVASGFFAKAVIPEFQGQNNFQGHVIHSAYTRPDIVDKDKKIIVCGGSFSGYELASEFAKVSHVPVVHLFRNPSWVLKRNFPDGHGGHIPLDFASYSRKSKAANTMLEPEEVRQQTINFFKSAFGNPKEAHQDLEVSEDASKPLFVVVSEDYLDLVRQEKIIPVRGHTYLFNKNSMEIDLREEVPADMVVMATGFNADLPFLDEQDKEKIEFDEQDQFMPAFLYETVWPKGIDDLGFVGFYRGSFFAVTELQARWVAGVFSGNIHPPSKHELITGIDKAKSLRQMTSRPQFPYADYVDFADRLARKAKCYPNVTMYDKMYQSVFEGPLFPPHYRLMGHGAKRELAEEILRLIPNFK